MKRLRRYGIGLFAITTVTGILIACGDDDAVLLATAADGGAASANSSPDTGTDVVTGVDVVTPQNDAGGDADAEATERDAQADVEIPPVDAGAPDADLTQLAMEFPARVATEMCRTTARCCFGNENLQDGGAVDGGSYNAGKCFNLYYPNGLDQSNPGTTVDFTKVTYDPSKAAECLGRIKVLACGANAAEYRAVISACYAALNGTGGAGSPCKLTSECQPGFFCNTATAGGTCEALRSTGAPCGDWTTNAGFAQHTCSNRFSGTPPEFCRFRDDAGAVLPAASWKCDDPLPAGSSCSNDSWCNMSNVCALNPGDTAPTCQGFISVFTPQACSFHVTQ